MKNKIKNVETKKIVHFLILIFMLLALIFGFVFSAIETNKGIKLGSQYRGSFQATVGVYEVNKKNDDQQDNLPNGEAKVGAEILQNKLSPFADGSINVTIDGLSRLIVSAPRDAYNNNQKLFTNAIQSTGGLFIFDDQYTDVMFNSTLMGKTGKIEGNNATELKDVKRSATSELLSSVEQVSRSVGVTNRPFLKFVDQSGYFAAINKGDDQQQPPTLKMVVDTPTLLDTLRDYFSFATNDDQLDHYLEVFLDQILVPLRNDINADNPKIKGDDRRILEDFFKINYWKQNTNSSWSPTSGSLLDSNVLSDLTVDGLKKVLYADHNPEHRFDYDNEITKYIYDPNAVATDFTNEDGKYHQLVSISNTPGIAINKVFNSLTHYLFPLLMDDGQDNGGAEIDLNANPFGIKEAFNRQLFSDFFIYNGSIAGPIGASANLPGPNQGSINGSDFYLGTKNYTVAKKAAAQIGQTTTGFTFHVFSVSEVDAVISNAMFILSIVALLIIALAIAIFILFFYRLLGLFTIIVAVTISGLTLLMNVVFGIVIGPEIIAIMFVLIGLIMDISVVLFEAFKNNIYLEKRPIITSFNISNRETLGLVIDVLLASLLPNIVLFWIGIGFLKNFATILTMGILFTFLFAVVVLRVMIYFTSRTSIWKKYPWLLPIDTSLKYDGRFIYHYLILLKEQKLEGYTSQSEINAKDLLEIKKLEEKIQILKNKDAIFIAKKTKKAEKKKATWERKWRKHLKVYKAKRSKQIKKKHPFDALINHYDQKIAYLNYLLKAGDNEEGESISVINDSLTRAEQATTKTGWITLAVIIFTSILAIAFSLTIGLNYSVNYGKGTQYYIYGTFVEKTYEQMSSGSVEFEKLDQNEQIEINQDLIQIANDSKRTVEEKHSDSGNINSREYEREWQALGVYQGYRYLISNDYLKYLNSRMTGVEFKNVVFAYGYDYSRIDPTTSSYVDAPWVSITTTNDLIAKNNAIKTTMQKFANDISGVPNYPKPPTNEGGVLGMTLEPHTTVRQMRQIAITFGIVLLALLVYMIIRFKWTYYVALALGLVLIVAFTVSAIIISRVPFSIEVLGGILGVLGFALITGMLFLGRGKSIIVSKDEKVLNDYFDEEIALQAKRKHLKLDFKNELLKLKKEQKLAIKALDKKDEDYRQAKKDLKQKQRLEYNHFKADQKTILTKQLDEIKLQINLEARKNNFLKEIFMNVLKFGLLRTVFLTSFYLAIGIVAAVTLPSIGIMGFTLTIGVVATTLVMITIVLPVWVQLERRRIRMRYGYKKFVNHLNVSQEEQIIIGLND